MFLRYKFFGICIFSILIVLIFYYTKINTLKFYPAFVNFALFLLFFISLFKKETVIQKLARVMYGTLAPCEVKYTRNLTVVWCVFLFLNFLAALLSAFLSDNFWIFYNGFLSYVLTAALYSGEYINRFFFKRRNGLC